MREAEFGMLRRYLLRSGVARSHVERIAAELDDHLDDLRHEAIEAGFSPEKARREALNRLGSQRELAQRILEFKELRTWEYRYPRIARVYFPLAYAILLPTRPLFSGLANPFMVVRWGAALMLSGFVTAGMLLCMQLAIVLT